MTLIARSHAIDLFLSRSGWEGATRSVLAEDASFRRYERVQLNERHAVLMDAPPDKEDVAPFLYIATHLVNLGYSAPRIHAQDAAQGFLLLEDLGDDSFSRVLRQHPDRTEALYDAATDWLVDLHGKPESRTLALPRYDEALYLRELSLFSDWFLPAALGAEKANALDEEYTALWQSLLPPLTHGTQFVHRDYHADNLLWLPERNGTARVGLLDFQDAVLGHAAYDLVSVLEDARRDVPPAIAERCIARYLSQAGTEEAAFRRDYALLGAQRNCKIVGIFTRLAVRDGKRHYLALLPRVWGHLEQDLRHPALATLKQWMDWQVPEPLRGELTLAPAA